jgi:indole-3-glycerol phosphate synthase
VQASSPAWLPPGGALGAILRDVSQRIPALRERSRELELAARTTGRPASMSVALRKRTVAVIAEVKRRSPSRGAIDDSLSAGDRSALYASGGAAAISVLTEPTHFGGTPRDLEAARGSVSLPLLRKDFHVDPVQLVQARALGASAALLIARALEPALLAEMVAAAADVGLEVVVEVHTEEELDRALALPVAMIGVNNRDLVTLTVDRTVSAALLPMVPADRVAIAESGIESRADVERAASAGADAVLVGSALSAATDPLALLRELTTVDRESRRA